MENIHIIFIAYSNKAYLDGNLFLVGEVPHYWMKYHTILGDVPHHIGVKYHILMYEVPHYIGVKYHTILG